MSTGQLTDDGLTCGGELLHSDPVISHATHASRSESLGARTEHATNEQRPGGPRSARGVFVFSAGSEALSVPLRALGHGEAVREGLTVVLGRYEGAPKHGEEFVCV